MITQKHRNTSKKIQNRISQKETKVKFERKKMCAILTDCYNFIKLVTTKLVRGEFVF